MIGNVLGITRATYGKKENGKLEISLEEALKLSEYYDVDITVFFESEAPDFIFADPSDDSAADFIDVRMEGSNENMVYQDNDLIRELSALLVEKEKEIKRLKQKIAQLEECKKRIKCIECPARQNCDKGVIN
jgi:transcriptional regulator with XRE-family HTH domain